jgi:hypothetical protein
MIAGGYFTPDDVEHGFFGPLGGPYTTFDLGDGTTQARGIANDGSVAEELIGSGGHCAWLQFIRPPGGTDMPVTKGHNAINGIIGNFNVKGQFAGDYCKHGVITGYLGKGASYKSGVSIDADNRTTSPRGVNESGTVAGFFIDASTGAQTAFVLQNGDTSIVSLAIGMPVISSGMRSRWTQNRTPSPRSMCPARRSRNSSESTMPDSLRSSAMWGRSSTARTTRANAQRGDDDRRSPARVGPRTFLLQGNGGSAQELRPAARPPGARDGDGIR